MSRNSWTPRRPATDHAGVHCHGRAYAGDGCRALAGCTASPAAIGQHGCPWPQLSCTENVYAHSVYDTAFCRCKRFASRTSLRNQSSHGTASRSRAQTVRSCDNLSTTMDRMLAGTDDDTSRSSIPDPGTRSRRSVAVEHTSGNVADVPRRESLVVE